jgi:hypothetical protein
MAVTVNIGASFEVGVPAPLFQTRIPVTGITDDRNSYLATPDGQKFLVERTFGKPNGGANDGCPQLAGRSEA